MLITRASRRDKDDIRELLALEGWDGKALDGGTAFIARQGPVIGCVILVEVEPQTVVVENVLVHRDRRGKGIGSQLMQAAMNSRGGTMYLCCHAERIAFYERLGFAELAFEAMPESVQQWMREVGDYPTDPGHVHHFMKAR